MYGLPHSTLSEHVSGKWLPGGRSGDPYLTVEEEEELVSFLVQTATIGYRHTKNDIHGMDGPFLWTTPTISPENGSSTQSCSSHGYWHRHNWSLVWCARKLFSKNRFVKWSSCHLQLRWNRTLCPKVINVKKLKHTSHACSGDKAQITVLACTCATGTALPPFVIFDRKSLNSACTKDEVPGTLYGLSKNGWMNQELFH